MKGSEKAMKNLYIFDMGGVVSQNTDVLPDVAAYLGIPEEDVYRWAREFSTVLLEGKLATREFWAIFSQRSGLTIEEELFGKFFDPIRSEPVCSLIVKLKQQHRVICGTNTIEEHYTIHLKRGDYTIFDTVYASHRMGFAKPRAEFYQYILEHENVPPSQTVFIDDRLKNVEAAQRLGIHSLHFRGYDPLMKQLAILRANVL
jgi:putative hydrolase of the HAD superfamily